MELLQEFNRIMEKSNNIALATSVKDVPNVRIVNFYYNPEKKGIVYFASFNGSPKTMELQKNSKVAVTTIPAQISEHVRINQGTVQKSDLTIYDLKDEFVKKLPEYEVTIAKAGHMLTVYEIHFSEANVILGIGNGGKITL